MYCVSYLDPFGGYEHDHSSSSEAFFAHFGDNHSGGQADRSGMAATAPFFQANRPRLAASVTFA